MRAVKNIVLHCTATPQSATVAGIERYWREQLKWKSPGYHIIIQPDGKAVRLASDDKVCNGVGGHNRESLHVSYIGGVDSKLRPIDNRTPAQLATMIKVVREWLRQHPDAKVLGHRDFPGVKKACPSFDARAWWACVSENELNLTA